MARYRFYGVLQGMNGEVISDADVFVYISGTNVPAKVYLTKEGGNPVDQPPQLRSDASGRVEFWVDLADYSPQTRFRIEAVKGSWLAVLDDVKIVEEDRYVYVQSSEPQERWVGVQWFDMSYSPPLLKVWDGSGWLDVEVYNAQNSDSANFALEANLANSAVEANSADNSQKLQGYLPSFVRGRGNIPLGYSMTGIEYTWINIPYWRVSIDTTSGSRTSPSGFNVVYQFYLVSYGTIWIYSGAFNAWSLLFEMKIYCPTVMSASQGIFQVDDNVYVFLNGSQIASATGAGAKNVVFSYNFVAGENLIQIVLNNSGGSGFGLCLLGDFLIQLSKSNPEVRFVPL